MRQNGPSLTISWPQDRHLPEVPGCAQGYISRIYFKLSKFDHKWINRPDKRIWKKSHFLSPPVNMNNYKRNRQIGRSPTVNTSSTNNFLSVPFQDNNLNLIIPSLIGNISNPCGPNKDIGQSTKTYFMEGAKIKNTSDQGIIGIGISMFPYFHPSSNF